MARQRPKGGGNPYLEDTGGHGNKSEARLAKTLNSEQRLNSGALPGLKGDFEGRACVDGVHSLDLLYEAKSTINKSLGVKKEWLDKITDEALTEGKVPALTISFVDEHGNARPGASDWVALPMWVWKELMNGDS